jgi:hypothetical protein
MQQNSDMIPMKNKIHLNFAIALYSFVKKEIKTPNAIASNRAIVIPLN